MIYQRPLAYLLGLEGTALLRAFGGDYDRDFEEARIAEIRRLLDSPSLGAEGVAATRVDTVDGYRVWSATYDQPGNGLFAHEQPVVHEILDSLPAGVALDAACGTGRYTEYLAAQGHRVIGVDSSPDMLARAHTRTASRVPSRRSARTALARRSRRHHRVRAGADSCSRPQTGVR